MRYLIAKEPTPVFNTPDLGAVFGGKSGKLEVDALGHMRALEMVAFQGTVFEIASVKRGEGVLQVTTKAYSAPYPLFVDQRFGKVEEGCPLVKKRPWPTRCQVIASLKSACGVRYVWGGNVRGGVPSLLTYYPPPSGDQLSSSEREHWTLSGLDCSGLLYEATRGHCPRNTADLLFHGKAVCIEGSGIKEMITRLKPLDLIVYPGHVVIVLTPKEAIESCERAKGVMITRLDQRLKKLVYEEGRRGINAPKRAVDHTPFFVIRRLSF